MFKSKINIIKKKLSLVKDLYTPTLSINIAKQKVVLVQTKFLLKKRKSLTSLRYLKIILKRNPHITPEFIFEINKQIPKVSSHLIHSFFRFCGDELIPSYSKLNLLQFKKDISKVKLAFIASKNTSLIKTDKLKEYMKYLVRTNSLDKTSQKDILRNLKRLNDGLINTKLTSNKIRTTCYKTYSGFLKVLKQEAPYFVTIKGKLYLGKSYVGNPDVLNGNNKLLLDLQSLDVFTLKTDKGNQIIAPTKLFLFEKHRAELSKEMIIYLNKLKQNYIAHYAYREFKTKEQKDKVIKRIKNIFSDEKMNLLNK